MNKNYTNLIRIIKKYQNRRLYDTATSSYIILEDIKQIILAGEYVQVIDAKTKADLTRSVLLQIITEEEIGIKPMLSNEFLFQVIKFYGNGFQPSISPFLEQGVELFKKFQRKFHNQLKNIYNNNMIPNGLELWQEFLKQQAPNMQESINEYVKNNTNNFLEMQEQVRQHTEKIFNLLQFPYVKSKK